MKRKSVINHESHALEENILSILEKTRLSETTVADPPVGDSATATPLEILYFHFSFTKMKKYGL
jgi:hypothetical protein